MSIKLDNKMTIGGMDTALTQHGTLILYPRSLRGCMFTSKEVRSLGQYLIKIADIAEKRGEALFKTSDVHGDGGSSSEEVNVPKRKRRRRTRKREDGDTKHRVQRSSKR